MATFAISPAALSHMALLSIQATSPERRFTQKEIIAGEERPKYMLLKQQQQQQQQSQQQQQDSTTPPALPGKPHLEPIFNPILCSSVRVLCIALSLKAIISITSIDSSIEIIAHSICRDTSKKYIAKRYYVDFCNYFERRE